MIITSDLKGLFTCSFLKIFLFLLLFQKKLLLCLTNDKMKCIFVESAKRLFTFYNLFKFTI